jgi:hypothetical protein
MKFINPKDDNYWEKRLVQVATNDGEKPLTVKAVHEAAIILLGKVRYLYRNNVLRTEEDVIEKMLNGGKAKTPELKVGMRVRCNGKTGVRIGRVIELKGDVTVVKFDPGFSENTGRFYCMTKNVKPEKERV